MDAGQKSWTMIRRPFSAWKRTAKKISSSANPEDERLVAGERMS
jgi:hypothetical protein